MGKGHVNAAVSVPLFLICILYCTANLNRGILEPRFLSSIIFILLQFLLSLSLLQPLSLLDTGSPLVIV
jgi:hypothetical protein